jgi:hypothetical protein
VPSQNKAPTRPARDLAHARARAQCRPQLDCSMVLSAIAAIPFLGSLRRCQGAPRWPSPTSAASVSCRTGAVSGERPVPVSGQVHAAERGFRPLDGNLPARCREPAADRRRVRGRWAGLLQVRRRARPPRPPLNDLGQHYGARPFSRLSAKNMATCANLRLT